MLQPTRSKFRKAHKGRIHGNASRCNVMNYGSFGLKAIQPERVISRQIEAARVALTRHMKRQGRVWTRMFPNIPVSKKPTEVRMGKGKGSPEYWACRVKPGRILFEMGGEDITEETAKEAMRLAQYKLPVKTKFISIEKTQGVIDQQEVVINKQSKEEVKKWKIQNHLKNLGN